MAHTHFKALCATESDGFAYGTKGNETKFLDGVTGLITLTVLSSTTAGGTSGANVQITQNSTALTGTLRGGYFVATNGTSAATGTIRGIEVKARAANPSNVGANVATIEGISLSADAKNKTVTTLRGAEIMLDGGAGGSSTTAIGLLISNNSSATQTTSYAIDINSGTASGHKAFTADIRLQNGETIDNATDGKILLTATTVESSAALNSIGDFSVATNKFTVAAASGNTVVAGTLGVTGILTTTASATIGTFIHATPIAAPGTPTEGDIYYDSTAHKLKVRAAAAWETVTSA